MDPTFCFVFLKYKATLTILLKFSESLIVEFFLLLAKLLNFEKKYSLVQKGHYNVFNFCCKFKLYLSL